MGEFMNYIKNSVLRVFFAYGIVVLVIYIPKEKPLATAIGGFLIGIGAFGWGDSK